MSRGGSRFDLICHEIPTVVDWIRPRKIRFALDSPLEGGGFEPSVPRIIMPAVKCGRGCRAGVPCVTTELIGGTEGSNPAPSSGSHHIAVQCSGRVTDGARDGIGGETAGRRSRPVASLGIMDVA